MFEKAISFIKKPFNLGSYFNNKLNLSLLHGVFVFIFLNIFEPFQLHNLQEFLFGYTILMGILTFIVPYLFFLCLEKTKIKNWSLFSFVALTLCFTVIYSFILWYFSGIYKDYFNINRLSFTIFFKYSASLALISTFFMLIVNEKLINLKTKKLDSSKEDEITLYSENKKENLTINIDKLIYITIDGNYASFFVETVNGKKEFILRNTLSNILKQISNYPFIIRCHKSYIINSLFFNEITGNARGYYLKSDKVENKIPVSRSFNKVELEKMLQI